MRTILLTATVILLATGTYAAVSDHVFNIEISTTYDYDLPDLPLRYKFDAWINVDDTVASGSVTVPSANTYPLEFEADEPNWLGLYVNGSIPSDLDDFGPGTYTFTVNYSGGGSDSTSIDYTLPNGDPIPQVTQEPQFIYPQHNAMNVPLDILLKITPASNPDWTIGITVDPADESLDVLTYEIEDLAYNTGSYGAVKLSPDTLYDIEYTFNHVVRSTNADGIPAVVDTDAECDIRFTTASESLSHPFWPMQVGQVWTYLATDNLGSSWTMTYEVGDKTSINGKEYFQLISRNYDNDGQIDVVTVRSTDEALYTWDAAQEIEKMDFILAPLGTMMRSFNGEEWEYRIVDRYERVSLGSLGTFEAVVYHAFPTYDDGSSGYPEVDRTLYWEEYFVPGFGFVKTVDTWFEGIGEPVPAYAPVTYVLTDISPSVDFCGMIGRPYPQGDLNQDCVVNMLDLARLATNWQQNTAP